ncbi:MAG TPA: glycosyltransferase family 2 protein [Methanomicrobia archaeon]|nr:glycosyltransferase family 2 protein [Methanomicrobia archaeon]
MREPGRDQVAVSVLFPAHNEAGKLEAAVEQTKRAITAVTPSYELVIAEDGSTDGSAELARAIAADDPFVRHMHSDARLGRGKALNRAFKAARGEVIMFMDVDLSTDLAYLKPLISAIRDEHYDLAIGSRLLRASETKRSLKRSVLSTVYNFLVRLILHSKLRDHQCGFKAFRRTSLLHLLDEIQDEHWFWDTELLVRAQRKGYRIKELPVHWEDKGAANTKVKAVSDSAVLFSSIIRLYFSLRRKKDGDIMIDRQTER